MKEIVLLALVVEATWESLKMIWEEGKVSVDRIGALVFGLITAIVYQIDLINVVGITSTSNYLGIIFTGVLISRGSNFVHDLIKKLGE